VTYRHLVFTLPDTLNGWVEVHPEAIYGLLFEGSRGGKPGTDHGFAGETGDREKPLNRSLSLISLRETAKPWSVPD